MNPIEILILDFDGTLVRHSKGRAAKDFLSSAILALCEARKEDRPFEGFYVCTARDAKGYPRYLLQYASAREVNFADGEKALVVKHNGNAIAAQADVLFSGFMSLSIATFTEVTKLELILASMSDDTTSIEHTECGSTFVNCIIPYEKNILTSYDSEKMTITFPDMPDCSTPKSMQIDKVDQLQQIIDDALARFPDRDINFTFIDDMRQHCLDAASYFNDIPRVKMTVKWIQSNGLTDIAPIVLSKRASSPSLAPTNLFAMQDLMAAKAFLTVAYTLAIGDKTTERSFASVKTTDELKTQIQTAKLSHDSFAAKYEMPPTLNLKIKGKIDDIEFDFQTDSFKKCDEHIDSMLNAHKRLTS